MEILMTFSMIFQEYLCRCQLEC